MNKLKEKIFNFFTKKNNNTISHYNYNNFFDSFTVIKQTFLDIKTQNFITYFFTMLVMFILYSTLSTFSSEHIINSNQSNNITYSNSSLFLIALQFVFSSLFAIILFLIPNSIYFFDNNFDKSKLFKKCINLLSFIPHIFLSFIFLLFVLYFLVKIFNVNLTLEELQSLQSNALDEQNNKNAFYALSIASLSIPFIIYFMHLSYLNNKYLELSFFKSYILTMKGLINNFIFSLMNFFIMTIFFILYLSVSLLLIDNTNLIFIFNIFSISIYGLFLKNFHQSIFKLNIEIIDNNRIQDFKDKNLNNNTKRIKEKNKKSS